MKKILKTSIVPAQLKALISTRPNADWEKFRKNKSRYKNLSKQLRQDQRGLCAYCEINLLESSSEESDFRVEHFHPKNPHTPPPNWALEWNNLLGVCHGGTQNLAIDPTRFTTKENFCCDAPKGGTILDGIILNPLTDIPAFPAIFQYKESGEIFANEINCTEEQKQKVGASITHLNLASKRLNNMRKEVMMGLNEAIAGLIASGHDISDAVNIVANAQFTTNSHPTFFTCVRWYLGISAENRLQQNGYTG
ncbi:retron Ec78 anti-phage system effector HNH endonuclease PtuB [Undibacterium sp. Ren11W]|uniref:retron Ec78 anti-phage system effector HNH endonuclease PtuB n=1 Tax=Undibacterium sp. Ren11W TaxID=3413045 RepID=UPI003BF068EC